MAKHRWSALIISIFLILSLGILFGCADNTQDTELTKTFNNYFGTNDVKIVRNFGSFRNGDIILVKTGSIENTLRKDSIDGIVFNYQKRMQLFAVTSDEVYPLKVAFLNLIVDLSTLTKVKEEYDKLYKTSDDANYAENGIAIVLESKYIWDGYVDWDFPDDSVVIVADKNFNNYILSIQDFYMLDVNRVECLTELLIDIYHGNYPENFNHIYELTISNAGKEEVIKAIRILEKLDFIRSAEPNYYGYLN